MIFAGFFEWIGAAMAERESKESSAFDPATERRRLLDLAVSSIEASEPHMRAPLIAQARALITDISPSSGHAQSTGGEPSGVVSFKEKLEARRANPKGKGRSRKSG